MSKKKKNKIKKLSEEEYNKYIMALKEEKSPKLVSDAMKNENWITTKILILRSREEFFYFYCFFRQNIV